MYTIGLVGIFLYFTLTQWVYMQSIGYNEILDINYTSALPIVKEGLPEFTDSKHFVVVGAGIAGLVAADLLKTAGYQVTILEANDKVGGRIQTYRDELGWYGDLGAMSFYSDHYLVKHYVKKYKLEPIPFIYENPNTYYYYNNIRARKNVAENDLNMFHFPGLTQWEKDITGKQGTLGLFRYVMEPIHQDMIMHNWSYVVNKYDQYSIREYLIQYLSQGAVNMLETLTNSNGFYGILQLYNFMYNTLYPNGKIEHWQILNGTERLPLAIISHLNTSIIYNAKVTSIKQPSNYHDNNNLVSKDSVLNKGEALIKQLSDLVGTKPVFKNKILNRNDVISHRVAMDSKEANENKVLVTYRDQTTGEEKTVTGDYVIVTATAKATSQIHFDPALSAEKLRALGVHYSDATKMFLYFSQPFWLYEGIYGGRSVTDLPIRTVYYPSYNMP